jgi:hypothetical protein
VPNVTNIIPAVLPADPWRSRLGASYPRSSFPGTGVPGVGSGTGPFAAVTRPVMRFRDKGALTVPATQLRQTNNYNHMTSVIAVGEGASGPPPYREPA